MGDYVRREDVIKAISNGEPPEAHYPFAYIDKINKVPAADPMEIFKGWDICGYNIEELLIFAHACREQGIAKEDMAECIHNIEFATKYIQGLVEKECDMIFDKLFDEDEEEEQEILAARKGEE